MIVLAVIDIAMLLLSVILIDWKEKKGQIVWSINDRGIKIYNHTLSVIFYVPPIAYCYIFKKNIFLFKSNTLHTIIDGV